MCMCMCGASELCGGGSAVQDRVERLCELSYHEQSLAPKSAPNSDEGRARSPLCFEEASTPPGACIIKMEKEVTRLKLACIKPSAKCPPNVRSRHVYMGVRRGDTAQVVKTKETGLVLPNSVLVSPLCA